MVSLMSVRQRPEPIANSPIYTPIMDDPCFCSCPVSNKFTSAAARADADEVGASSGASEGTKYLKTNT